MPWFRVDDSLAFHRKAAAAGNSALGLWVRAGAWSAQQLEDGYVPDHIVKALGTTAQAKKLVDAGMWTRIEGGYEFHQWHERQPSKAEIEKKRAEWRDRQRRKRGGEDD